MFIVWMTVLFVICLILLFATLFYLGSGRTSLAFFYISLILGTISVGVQLISNHFDWAPNLYWTAPALVGVSCLVIAWIFATPEPQKDK